MCHEMTEATCPFPSFPGFINSSAPPPDTPDCTKSSPLLHHQLLLGIYIYKTSTNGRNPPVSSLLGSSSTRCWRKRQPRSLLLLFVQTQGRKRCSQWAKWKKVSKMSQWEESAGRKICSMPNTRRNQENEDLLKPPSDGKMSSGSLHPSHTCLENDSSLFLKRAE